jgi:hypothetical protein
MTDRDQEILQDPWASKNYCDVPRRYIDIPFRDGVDWADQNPDYDLICQILWLHHQGKGAREIYDYFRGIRPQQPCIDPGSTDDLKDV